MKRRLISLFLVVAMVLSMIPTTAFAQEGSERYNPYEDVSESDWFYDGVLDAMESGLFSGISSDSFDPTGNMSRAMYVTVMGRMAGIDVTQYSGDTGFSDVTESHWAAPYVLWAKEMGTTVSDVSLRKGTTLDSLPIPYKADSIFLAWCYDEALTQLVETSDTATESLILYAKYQETLGLTETESTPTAIALDEAADFSITVNATESMELDDFKDAITATNLSSNQDLEWFYISGSGTTFTIAGYNYNGVEGARQIGFVEGYAYKIELNDDNLTFAGMDAATRIYDFTIARADVMNVSLNSSLQEISLNNISDLEVNGQSETTISLPIITVGTAASDTDNGITAGSFTLTGGTLSVGDTVMIYEGNSAPDMSDTNMETAFVEITEDNGGDNYSYQTADVEDVLFTPDVLPVSIDADTDDDLTDDSITVAVSDMTFTDDKFAVAGLDSQTTIDVGDFISFYSGTLQDDGTLDGGTTESYGEITSVTSKDGYYTIAFTTVTLTDLQAATYLAAMALETNSFTELSQDYDLTDLEITMDGQSITQEDLKMLASTTSTSTATEATGGVSGATAKNGTYYEISTVQATLGTNLQHFDNLSGLRLTLSVGVTITTQKKINGTLSAKDSTLENVGQQIKDLMDAADKYIGDGDATVQSTLEEKYVEMLETESAWVTLFDQSIMNVQFSVLLVISIEIDLSFVITANMNITVGATFWYENAKRYIYTISVFSQDVSNQTIDLVEESYHFDFYVMGTMGLRAGIRLSVSVGLFSTDLASVGFTVEAGAYVRIWGYFYYEYNYTASSGSSSAYTGALLFELGIYTEIKFLAQALSGTYSYNPTLYSDEWPLLSAGVRENVRDFAYSQEDVPSVQLKQYIKTTQIPDNLLSMAYLDLKTGYDDDGNLMTASYDTDVLYNAGDEAYFTITMTNDAFSYDPTTNQITVTPDSSDDGKEVEIGEMIITWITQSMAFTSEPIQRTIPLYWDNLNDGYVIVPYTNGGSYVSIIVKAFEEAVTTPDNPTKEGYIFDGWYSNEGLTTAYRVEYYVQQTDGTYALQALESFTGETDQVLDIGDLKKDTYLSEHGISFKNVTVNSVETTAPTVSGDGSTVVKVNYERAQYTITFDPENGGRCSGIHPLCRSDHPHPNGGICWLHLLCMGLHSGRDRHGNSDLHRHLDSQHQHEIHSVPLSTKCQ